MVYNIYYTHSSEEILSSAEVSHFTEFRMYLRPSYGPQWATYYVVIHLA